MFILEINSTFKFNFKGSANTDKKAMEKIIMISYAHTSAEVNYLLLPLGIKWKSVGIESRTRIVCLHSTQP